MHSGFCSVVPVGKTCCLGNLSDSGSVLREVKTGTATGGGDIFRMSNIFDGS